jgi:hypothetical protein
MVWRRRYATAVGVATACLIGLAACTSGPKPDEWAGHVCAALRPWRSTITDLNARAQQQMTAATTPDQARASLLQLLAGAQTASENARAAVAAAGTPDVTGGAEIARRFVTSLERVRDAYSRARTDVQALATRDDSAFYDGVAAALTRLNAEYAASAVDTTAIDSVELRAAFDGIDECR